MGLSLLKLFIPSWNFFAESGEKLDLVLATQNSKGIWSEWVSVLDEAFESRSPRHLFFSPQENLRLHFLALLERFVQIAQDMSEEELQKSSQFQQLTSFLKKRISDGSFVESKKHSSELFSLDRDLIWKWAIRGSRNDILVEIRGL